jgi:hypothetical protein
LRGIEEEPFTSQSLSREPKTRDQFRNLVSLVGYPLRKTLGENGRGLSMEGSTKSPPGIKISMEENSNLHGGDLGTKSHSWVRKNQREKLFRREKVTSSFIDRS